MSIKVVERTPAVSPVKHGAPAFIKKVLKREFPDRDISSNYDTYVRSLEEFLEGIGVDHWGSTDWNGITCFVTEPYGMREERVFRVKEKCRKLGHAVVYSPIAFHNDGCRRLLIFPTDLSLVRTYPEEVIAALTEAGCRTEERRIVPKDWHLRKSDRSDKAAFESAILNTGRVAYDFFDSPVSITRDGDSFQIHCLRTKQASLARTLNATKRKAKAYGAPMPEVVIRPISDDELIYAGDGFYAGNCSDFIGGFVQRYVPVRRIESVESVYRNVFGKLIKSSLRAEPDKYSEQHILFELQTPITFAAFRDLIEAIESQLGKGFGTAPKIGKGRAWRNGCGGQFLSKLD